MTESITLVAPDDWHIHLRDGSALSFTVNHAAHNVERAIIMPNLVPPVLNAEQVIGYKDRIMAEVPKGQHFEPLMVLYLTDNTSPQDIIDAKAVGVVACKLYPAGATTNSDSGVTDISRLSDTFKTMESENIKLLLHGEVTDSEIDIFDREAAFLKNVLPKIIALCPSLKIVLEHITTKEAVDFVNAAPDTVAATITAHHLLFNRNHMLSGGIRPHYYCLPILKRNIHQEALIEAATSGNPKFFAGTDSAPHAKNKKENACGCAGSYTAFAMLELYAQAFEYANAMDKLEGFTSFFGPDFYQLPRNTKQVTLVKSPWEVPATFDYLDDTIVPIFASEQLIWRRQ